MAGGRSDQINGGRALTRHCPGINAGPCVGLQGLLANKDAHPLGSYGIDMPRSAIQLLCRGCRGRGGVVWVVSSEARGCWRVGCVYMVSQINESIRAMQGSRSQTKRVL